MQCDTPACSMNAAATVAPELRFLEGEARRLRAEHAGDPLARLFIEIDYGIRGLARRIAARLLSPRSTASR